MRFFGDDRPRFLLHRDPTLRKVREGWGTRIPRVAQALIVVVLVCFSLGATDSANRFNKVGGKLMCTCGCAQMLLGCDHVGCPNRGDEMDRLRSGIAGGLTDAGRFSMDLCRSMGWWCLAAPPAKGF